MNNIVKYEVFLRISFSNPEKTRQPIIIPTINIPPKKRPDKIIPPGTFANLKSKAAKSPSDISPNIIFNLRSVVIIAGNWTGLGEVRAWIEQKFNSNPNGAKAVPLFVNLRKIQMYYSVQTGEVISKDKAVDYLLPIAPDEFKPLLLKTKAVYLGESNNLQDTDVDLLHQFADVIIRITK